MEFPNAVLNSEYIFSPEVSVPLVDDSLNSETWNVGMVCPDSTGGVLNGCCSSGDLTWPGTDDLYTCFPNHQLGMQGIEIAEPPMLVQGYDYAHADAHIMGFYGNLNAGGGTVVERNIVDFKSLNDHPSKSSLVCDELMMNENFQGLFVSEFQNNTTPACCGGSNGWVDSQENHQAVQLQSSILEEDEPIIKVRRYTEEERKDRILKYLKKKNQRNFNKTIKYACRKTLADRRIRVRGRFARNNEIVNEKQETTSTSNDDDLHHRLEEDYYGINSSKWKISKQMISEDEDEDWLHDAITSLMCLPIFAG